jgi:hypothetical protein
VIREVASKTIWLYRCVMLVVVPYAYVAFGVVQTFLIGSYLEVVRLPWLPWLPWLLSIAKWPLAGFLGFAPLIGTLLAIYPAAKVDLPWHPPNAVVVGALLIYFAMCVLPTARRLRSLKLPPVLFVRRRSLPHPLDGS